MKYFQAPKPFRPATGTGNRRLYPLPQILLALALCLSACDSTLAKTDAIAVTDNYFAAVKYGSPDKALQLYAPSFFEDKSKRRWLQQLKTVQQKLGKFRFNQLTDWRIQEKEFRGEKGHYVILNYQVEYARASAEETIALFKSEDADRYRIVDHNIHSPGLA